MAPLRVSYSTVQTVRDCEQKYVYRYIDRLSPVLEDATPLHLGTAVHTYLEVYYGLLKTGQTPALAHTTALEMTGDKHTKELHDLAKLAAELSQDELARSLLEIVPRALTLAKVYHRVHEDDIRRHEILLVEEKFLYPVKEGVVLPGRIDLVTRDRTTKEVILWEHKTAKRIPRVESRLGDLQTFLYNLVLEEEHGLHADVILWDYIQTVPPKPPKLLKDGTLSKASDQVTTVELYVKALRDNREALEERGQTFEDYRGAIEAVRERERRTMTTRYELPVVGREDVLLADYLRSVEHIEALNKHPDQAVRNIGWACNFCPFDKLCRTVLTGGNEDSDRRHFYTVEPERKPEALATVPPDDSREDVFDGI